MTKETKYFMAGTDEEVLLGDVIEQVLTKDLENGGKITRNVEFKLTEETLPLALGLGIIEKDEVEEEENNNLLDFGEDGDMKCPYEEVIQDLVEDQEELEKKVDILEEQIKSLKNMVETLDKYKDKNASPKKK